MIKTTLLIALAVVVLALSGARVAYPALMGYETYSIRTPSMQPNLPPGALVYVDSDAEYKVGDIVTFSVGSGEFVTHRLEAEQTGDGHTGPLFRSKGDANNAPDSEYVHRDNIVGKVVSYLPLLGWADTILRIPQVMTMILLIALAILVLPVILNPTKPIVVEPTKGSA